jgi:hypothetical protein
MSLLLLIIYIAFKVMFHKDISSDNMTPEKKVNKDINIHIEQNCVPYENS